MISLRKTVTIASSHGKSELDRISYLDGWRGLAISFVLIAHFLPETGIDFGRMGVDIFFVLSGLLMSKILFIKRVPLTIFYKRRISRIFPVFFIYISIITLSSYMMELSNEHENYFYSLLFLRTYLPETPAIWNTGVPIGHLWSLSVEEHCYIILSVITLFSLIKGREFLVLLNLGVLAIVLHYTYTKYPEIVSQSYNFQTEIASSHLFISSGYYLLKHNFERYIFSWMPIVAFILGILCYSGFTPWYAEWLMSPFLFAFTVNHLDRIPVFFKDLLSNRPLQLLGIWSYSIYLWQQPFYEYGKKIGEPFAYANILFLFLAIFVGVLSFYFIENPIRRYLNNRW